MTKILIADDDEIFLAMVRRLLEDYGYDVVTAKNPADALLAFESHRIDVAVLDYRLRDSKPGDRSGLDVAMKTDQRVPKIIVSDKAERSEIMDAVQTSPEGLALAVAFLAKDDIGLGKPKLFEAIQKALKMRKLWTRQAREAINPELYRDFTQASRFANWQVILHLLSNIAFLLVMVWAAFHVHEGVMSMVFLMVGLIAAEVTNLLLAIRGKEVSLIARADRYHRELLQSARFEQLLAACDMGTPADMKEARLEIIRSATAKWLGASADGLGREPASFESRRAIVGE